MFATKAREVVSCCRLLATHTDEPGGTTRTFLSPPMRDVHAHLTRLDGALRDDGSRGRRRQSARCLPGLVGAPRRACSSARTSTPSCTPVRSTACSASCWRRARRWAASIAACRSPLRSSGSPRRRACASACPSSAAARSSGSADEELLGRRDAHGRSIADAIRDYGLDPSSIAQARVDADAIGYVEFHIEQGPVLDGLGVPLAIVDAIAGQSRFTMTFTGSANHAGTTPMHARRDALAGAAEWIGRVEAPGARHARSRRDRRTHHGRARRCQRHRGQLRGQSRRAAWRRRRARRCGRDAAGRGSPDRVAAGARRRLGHDARPAVSRDESGAGGDARTRGPRPEDSRSIVWPAAPDTTR